MDLEYEDLIEAHRAHTIDAVGKVYETDGPATIQFARRLAAGTINLPYELEVRSHAHRQMQRKHIRGTYGGAPFKVRLPLQVAMQDMHNALAKAGTSAEAGTFDARGGGGGSVRQKSKQKAAHRGKKTKATWLPPLRGDEEDYAGDLTGDDDHDDSVFV